MKKIYFLLVFLGALFFCACENDNADLLIDDPAQFQFEEGALKGAKKHAVPFRGEFDQKQTLMTGAPPVIYVELEGIGNATHLGKTKIWVGQNWDFGDFTSPAEGAAEVIFTAANGDELHAYLYAYNAIELDASGNPVFATVWGSGHFTGGTGRFSDATGTYDLTAFFDFLTGESKAWYKGEIMY
jgi:hypothetical protein